MKEDFDNLGFFFTIFILLLIVVSVTITIKKMIETNLSSGTKQVSNEGYNSYNPYNQYPIYSTKCASPEIYHRYQSNLCVPTQDELPITMPDPNEGQEKCNMDKTRESVYFQGSLPCNAMNKYWLCS